LTDEQITTADDLYKLLMLLREITQGNKIYQLESTKYKESHGCLTDWCSNHFIEWIISPVRHTIRYCLNHPNIQQNFSRTGETNRLWAGKLASTRLVRSFQFVWLLLKSREITHSLQLLLSP